MRKMQDIRLRGAAKEVRGSQEGVMSWKISMLMTNQVRLGHRMDTYTAVRRLLVASISVLV